MNVAVHIMQQTMAYIIFEFMLDNDEQYAELRKFGHFILLAIDINRYASNILKRLNWPGMIMNIC